MIDFDLDPRSANELERQRVAEVEKRGKLNDPDYFEHEQQEKENEIHAEED
jgi:hypothetical protein